MVAGYNRERFLKRLNAPAAPSGKTSLLGKTENVGRLLELLAELRELDLKKAAVEAPVSNRMFIDGEEREIFKKTRLDVALYELNERAKRLRFFQVPEFGVVDGRLRCSFTAEITSTGDTASLADARIAWDLYGAVATGDLDNLKRCDYCREWMVKQREAQKFCKTRCREKAFKETPEFKSERAKYMRKYRKEENERAKRAQAKAVRGKK